MIVEAEFWPGVHNFTTAAEAATIVGRPTRIEVGGVVAVGTFVTAKLDADGKLTVEVDVPDTIDAAAVVGADVSMRFPVRGATPPPARVPRRRPARRSAR